MSFLTRLAALCALSASATLGGCTGINSLPSAPQDVAARTALDEQAALGVELAYQAAALAGRTALRADLLPAEQRPAVRAADARAYAAVAAVRRAYDVGNARSYAEALPLARDAIAELVALSRGGSH